MRHYMIYLIEEEVAKHYAGNELKLFQLFLQYEKEDQLQDVVKQQVDYITIPIPTFPLQQALETSMKHIEGYQAQSYQHKIEKKDSMAKLSIFEKYLKLSSSGSYEAEAIFFEVIRKLAPFFLAIDTNSGRFGWLQPIKQRKYV
ncbi:sporulation inhibitor of replication protein SirA [Bacillus tianshenii]|uniref:sporulation inhibitor of replication protein SirA n=1 Tax=Sutcliffiella tianshenii TaxID=1463404 RepID=UPI001CD417BA|nr:sporulation inhibitor of replication protein SirA [Bacillus tianshenii]MCA1320820.1 sporulation inhibitor of replication protein SirA [Bacillus tianshenii]